MRGSFIMTVCMAMVSFINLGIYTARDKTVYSGDWKFNKMDGGWKYFSPNGSKYEGEVRNDIMEGYGLYEW
jgi:hypothetical protein